jgi:hypothetical protein
MDVTAIIANSIKYPLRNIKKIPLLFILFILIAIVPLGMVFDNDHVVLLGVIAFFAFILIVPGYFLSIVKTGSNESSLMPSFNIVRNIYDSIRVLALRIVYMIVPAVVFYFALTTIGPIGRDLLYSYQILGFILSIGLVLAISLIIYLLFEFFLFFAKARLAYFNSLSEALKIHKVIADIRNIGIIKIIKWVILMVILMVAVSAISSVVISIPYVGLLIYICIIIPTLESIGNYSLGLLYSNIARNNEYSLDRLEREIQIFKYKN